MCAWSGETRNKKNQGTVNKDAKLCILFHCSAMRAPNLARRKSARAVQCRWRLRPIRARPVKWFCAHEHSLFLSSNTHTHTHARVHTHARSRTRVHTAQWGECSADREAPPLNAVSIYWDSIVRALSEFQHPCAKSLRVFLVLFIPTWSGPLEYSPTLRTRKGGSACLILLRIELKPVYRRLAYVGVSLKPIIFQEYRLLKTSSLILNHRLLIASLQANLCHFSPLSSLFMEILGDVHCWCVYLEMKAFETDMSSVFHILCPPRWMACLNIIS